MKVIEHCQVSPPPNSLSSPTILPLTFFDIPWAYLRPVERIFFFHFPHPTHHFLQTTFPILKNSLSLTLQHFFPFSSNLIIPPNSQNGPYIRYQHGDSLSFTVSESSANFNLLISDSQDAQNWHPLVPNLPPPRTEQNGARVIPIMAIQLTVLPNHGISIGLTFRHVAGDGKSLHHFIKYWASLSKASANNQNNSLSLEISLPLDLPSHERDRVKDTKGLKLIYLQDVQVFDLKIIEYAAPVRDSHVNKVRTTLVLSYEQVQSLKKWVADKCKNSHKTQHVSTFVITSSLIWFCMVKSEKSESKSDQSDYVVDDLCYFTFNADCRDSSEFSLPKTYFGNCLASYILAVKRNELVGENGIAVASNIIGNKIIEFKSDALLGAETLISDCSKILKPGNSVVMVAGSPKLGVYETDFGWGKPVKSDAVHLDSSGSISLSDCRDGGAGIEIGLALESTRMTNFINIFQQQLDNICSM